MIATASSRSPLFQVFVNGFAGHDACYTGRFDAIISKRRGGG